MVGHLPLELAAVVALFALPGVYFLWIAVKALPDSLRLVSNGYFGHAFGLALLVLLLVVAALGVALLLIARMLYRGSRVGRGLAYVAVASTVLFEDQQSGAAVLVMLASLAAATVLAFAPAVREVFNAADAPDADQPTSIVSPGSAS